MTKTTCECQNIDCFTDSDIFQKELSSLVNNSLYNNKQRRFHAYRVAAAALNLKQRQKLPRCIEIRIKYAFPEETGDYTWFKSHQ